MTAESKDVFISYAHSEVGVVEAIAAQLVSKGCSVWFDKWDMIPADNWMEVMQEAINACSCCALFIREQEPEGWQAPEIQLALNRKQNDKSKKFRVIPVLLNSPKYDEMKVWLSKSFIGLNSWVDFKHPDPGYPIHLLYCGIKSIKPGRYVPAEITNGTPKEERDRIRDALRKAAQWHDEQVLDDEGYRTLVNKILDRSLDELLKDPVHG